MKIAPSVMLDKTLEAIRRKDYERGLRDGARKAFTPTERRALRAAATEALAGQFQGNIAALERALEKL